jgi:hypothetical protein
LAYRKEQPVTKEEIMAAILACKEKLGETPTIPQLTQHTGIDRQQVRRFFGNYQAALEACHLEVPERGRKLQLDRLFRDWAEVVRKLKKLPTVFEYEQHSNYSEKPLSSRFGTWGQVPEALKLFAEKNGLVNEWRDVMELIQGQGGGRGGDATLSAMVAAANGANRAIYGAVIGSWAHVYAPTNESGVVCLFGAMAEQLGFMVLRIQTEFPDCEAIRKIGPEKYQAVRIEFGYDSRNFLRHGHDPEGCDLIVCWEDNWEECPLEVVELRGRLPKLKGKNLTTNEHG